jgi:hypothetical protein
MSKPHFGHVIADFQSQMGIAHLDDLPVAVTQAKEYGFDDVAIWLTEVKERFYRAIEEEWNAQPFDNASDSST